MRVSGSAWSQRHFTHSKVMAWVAFDRAIKSAEQFGLSAPLERWQAVRKQIHNDVCNRGFDNDLAALCNRTVRRIWMRACC